MLPHYTSKKNCQVLVNNLNFVAGMTRRFVSAKRLIRHFSNSSKLVVVQSFYGKKSVNLPLIATEGFSTVLDPAMYP